MSLNVNVAGTIFSEASNSSWAELETLVIGNFQIYPLTDVTKQILILRYLTPLGEYQEVGVAQSEGKYIDYYCFSFISF